MYSSERPAPGVSLRGLPCCLRYSRAWPCLPIVSRGARAVVIRYPARPVVRPRSAAVLGAVLGLHPSAAAIAGRLHPMRRRPPERHRNRQATAVSLRASRVPRWMPIARSRTMPGGRAWACRASPANRAAPKANTRPGTTHRGREIGQAGSAAKDGPPLRPPIVLTEASACGMDCFSDIS
jgi:hypothetical protein